MNCPSCRRENPPGNTFCGGCGAALVRICPNCKRENPPSDSFCGGCGTGLCPTASNETARRTREESRGSTSPPAWVHETLGVPADGERKTVTMLFADIKGSMELIEDLDPEEARAIVDPALKLMMEAVQRYSGYVAQPTGDGIFALFGAPVAHEDHARRALLAALSIITGKSPLLIT